ncbi:RHS repeat-associated core domain-containing protein [Delftia sp. DS1230]|uniref:RHS repeat-associated core domain-containing protein n=1 Tax=Delftia sp. DS1230 TaxID=3153805 RepID=UPI000B33DAD1
MQTKLQEQEKEQQARIAIHHYHCDYLGTPMALTDQRGLVTWAAKLDPWGNVLQEYNPQGIHQAIRLLGQHHDRETGLYYNRHRYYDPVVGSYINQDPIGLMGGVNFFTYPSNPLLGIDPTGLSGVIPKNFGKGKPINPVPIPEKGPYPLDKVYDQINPNDKVWKRFSPFDYTIECLEWESDNEGGTCRPFDEKPGKTITRSHDSIPSTPKSMPLPVGEKCNKSRLKSDPTGPGTAPTADTDDILEMMQKIRTRTRGTRR